MIKNLMFDFAGVVAKTTYHDGLSSLLATKYGVDKKEVEQSMRVHSKGVLLGLQTTEQFWEKAIKKFGIPFEDFRKSFAHWFELDYEIIDWIKEHTHYRRILHSDNFSEVTNTIKKHPDLQIFDSMYFSDEIGLLKTNPKSFKLVIEEEGIYPEETLFIDDHEKNVIAAEIIGIHGLVYNGLESLKGKLLDLKTS